MVLFSIHYNELWTVVTALFHTFFNQCDTTATGKTSYLQIGQQQE